MSEVYQRFIYKAALKCYNHASEETVHKILEKLKMLREEDDIAFISDFDIVSIDLDSISEVW